MFVVKMKYVKITWNFMSDHSESTRKKNSFQ